VRLRVTNPDGPQTTEIIVTTEITGVVAEITGTTEITGTAETAGTEDPTAVEEEGDGDLFSKRRYAVFVLRTS